MEPSERKLILPYVSSTLRSQKAPPPSRAHSPPFSGERCDYFLTTPSILFKPFRFVTTMQSVSVIFVGQEQIVVFHRSVEQKVSGSKCITWYRLASSVRSKNSDTLKRYVRYEFLERF